MAFVFIISAFITTPAVVKIKREKLPIELLIGTLFGICGIFASGLRVWALSEVDGTIVFPATTITVTVAVQLLGITIFGERPEKVDIFGYLTALAGIVCLACM
jgi:drug/metabolite transporter (DMT)-like permease